MLKFLSNNSVLFLSKVLFAIFISFFFLTGCGNGKEDNVYVVTFLSEGGDVLRKLEVPMGDSLKVPSPLFKQDHTFMGWLELDGTQMIPDGITSYTPVKDMTFKALYAPDNAPAYTVIFIDYDDSVIKTVNVTSGSSMPLPPSPQRRDYTFIGWLEVSQIGMIPDGVPSYTPSRNIVFKAAYIPNNSNDFNVIFIDENDNIIQELNVTKGKSLVVPLPTIPQDYTFMGWQEVNGTKMLAKGVRAYTPTDNIIFKALYVSDSAPTYTLIFLDEDDDIVAARNVTKGQSLNVPTAPNKPNYTFTLWQEMGGSETISSDSYTPTNSSVFKAVYSPLKYTVIFFSDTDQLISTQSVLAGQSVLVPTTPQKEHYRFVHWSEVGGDENLSNTSSSYTPTKDITFKALFTPIIYQVTFLRDDGSVMSSINATSGSSVNVPQALDIQDFTFLGYIEAGGKEMLAKGVATYAPTKDITFKPRYVSNQASIFTVIFLDEDDNIAHEFNVTKGNSLTIPTPFVKIDHTFMGWAEVEGAVTIYDGLFTPTHDTIFKALYIPNDPTIFKALFLDENNHILYEFNVTKGSSFTIPSAPVKSDHIFVSWLEVNGDKSMSPGTYTPTHDIIFKALYLPSSPTYFSVIFIDESHNILKEFNVTKGSSITPPPAPNKPNHTFISWAEVGGTKTITSKPYTPTKDTAFKASYIQNGASTYKILFLDEDDSVIGDMDIPQGSSAPIPSAPVKTGKLFMGWFEIDAASVLISGSFTPAKNSIFKAMYTDESASSYAVIFLDEDNSLLNEFDIAKGQPLSTIPTASPKPNHTFIGWSEVGGSQMIPNGANSYTPTKNIIFKPSYVSSAASAYTLIFLDEDNSVIGEINITKGSSTIIPTAPSKPNRTFKLWLEVNGSESLTTGSYTPTKNTIFKALYLPNSQTSYTLILLDDNNNFLNEFNITKGNSVAIPEAPVKPNYTFMAWLELNGSESLFGNSYTPTKDIIFRAFYTQGNPSSYKIYFLDEDNRILEELSIPKGQHLNIPTPTPKPNHTFMGWVELNGEDILDDGSYIPTKDTIFKVLYLPDDPSSFTVLFFGDNNIIISNITIDVGEPLNVPAAPAKPSYTFANWLEVNANKRLSKTASSYIPTKNTLFKALYLYDSPATFSAVFLDDKNRIIKSFNVTRGDHITTPAAPSKSDYTFKIWLELNGPESLDDGSYTPTKNILFYALYLPSDTSTEYTTIFIDDENNAISQISVPKGDSLFPPFAPDKQNYAFVGYEEIGGSQMIPEGSTLYTPVKHALFKASYTPDSSTKYRVIFLNEDSTIAYEFNITKGDSFIIPQATDKPNHTFMGYQEVGGSKMIISGTYTPVKNITFIPLYTSDSASTYTVIFLDEENILFNGNITKGDPVAVPKAPAKADSIFKGWFEINGTQVLPNGTSSYTPTKNALFKSLYIPTSLTTYTVIFLDDNNDPTSTFNVTKGDSITVPQAPDKPNHTFIIYEEVNGTKALVSGLFTPTEDTLFKALYLPDTAAIYTTIFVDDDSNIVEEINVTKGNSLTIPNAPQKTELTFVEWREITGGLTLNSGSYIPTKNAIFKAVYTQTIYTVSFLDDSTTTNINGAFGDNITIPQASPKPNHTFMGWVNAALMLPGDMTTFTITKSTTFKALYADDTSSVYSTIFLDEEGAIIKEINVTKGDSLTAPKAPSKTDHTFLGFKEVGGDTIITSSPFTPTKNAVFKALFVSDTAAAYTTIFIDDNDNIINTINTTKGDTLAVPTASGKPHYTFTKYEEMGGSASIPSGTTTYTPVNNTVFKAIYTINIYTVTFLNDDSSYVGSFNEPYGTTITIPKPTKQDYTFLGWREAGSQLFLDKAVSSYTITKTTSFKAVYSEDASTIYTTIFLDEDGFIIEEINVTKGNSLTVPKARDIPNHTFIGYKEANGSQMITLSSYTPTKNAAFKAVYIPDNAAAYTTIFIDDNDNILKEVNTTKGSGLTTPNIPDKPHYTFTHWQEVGGSQTITATYHTPTKNAVFKATYTIIIFTVAFFDDNGDIIGTAQQVNSGQSASVPNAPAKPNYTFTHFQEVSGSERIPSGTTTYTPTKSITFKAEYSAIIYKVTFQKENGDIEKEYNEVYGTSVNIPQVPNKQDHTPIGWLEEGGSKTILIDGTASYTVTKNITFKPYYLPNSSSNYTTIFLDDNDEVIAEINTTKGQPLIVPPAPAKLNHTFIGYMETGGNQMIPTTINSYTPTKNAIFKAEYISNQANTYSVIFLDDNNDVIRKDNVTKGDSITIPTATPKTEHIFTNYQEIGGTTTLTSGSYTPTKDIIFKAQYTPIIYTITFTDDNDQTVAERNGTKGQSVTVPTATEKKDYEFTHWQEEGGADTIQKGTKYYTVTKTTTFKAQYIPIIYTIIFLGDNDQQVANRTGAAGTSIEVPTAPIITGYTFTHWIETGGTKRIESSETHYTVIGNETFKAEYSINTYTATFLDENNGPVASPSTTYGSDIQVPQAPDKTEHTFTRWQEVGGTVTIPSGTTTYTLTRDITFKPEYTQITYKVSFQKENGDIVEEFNEVTGTTIKIPNAPIKTDHTFIGWLGDVNKTMLVNGTPSYTITKNITFKPLYLPNTSSNYTTIFLDDINSVIAQINTTKGDSLTVPTPPIKQDHTFIGYSEIDGTQMIPSTITTYTPIKNAIFKAQYTSTQATTYTVIFLDDNDDIIFNDNVTKGSSITIPTPPPKTEHTFTHYQEIGGTTTITSGSYTPTKDIIFKAQYTPIIYTVTFVDDNNAIIGTPQTGTKGQSAAVPTPAPTKKDYDFTHWQEVGGTDIIQKGTTTYTITKTITFKATYTPIIYILKFLNDNDQEVANRTGAAGTSVTVPDAPALPNYTFTSWIEIGGTERIPSTSSTYIITRDVTFKAQYNPIIYTATFFNENNVLVATRNGTYGTVVDVPTAPNRAGYTFTQWKENGGSVTIPSGTTTYTLLRDITFKSEYREGGEIRTQADLNDVRNNPSGKYKLMNDIALSSGPGLDVNGWMPIGTYSSNPFKGTFDGNGHKITGLWIDRGSTDYVGLFSATLYATIKNLGVEIGSRGVKGQFGVGGIAGYMNGGSITNSYSTGSVSGGNDRAGGIVGHMNGGSITNSYSTGSVSGGNNVGGIAGYMQTGCSITNSYSTGSVSGNINVGGIAARSNGGVLTNNAAINPSVSGTNGVNRIVGSIESSSTVSNNFALNTMTVRGQAGGNSGTSKTIAQLRTQTTYAGAVSGNGYGGLGWRFGNGDGIPWKISSNKNNGLPYLYWENR